MWKGCIFMFTLSHGQSSVERSFNANKDTLKDNFDSLTLEALCVCYDELIVHKNNIKSFEITEEPIHSCKLASKRYREYLQKKESDKKN